MSDSLLLMLQSSDQNALHQRFTSTLYIGLNTGGFLRGVLTCELHVPDDEQFDGIRLRF